MPAVRELTDESERRAAVPVLRQLWSDRDPEAVLDWTASDDYRLFGRFADGDAGTHGSPAGGGELVAVAGLQVQSLLHHRRGAWLVDLVVDEPHRGEGHGAAMLEFVEAWAAEQDCEYVALASPLAKSGVHEFYDDLGYERWGYVIETEV